MNYFDTIRMGCRDGSLDMNYFTENFHSIKGWNFYNYQQQWWSMNTADCLSYYDVPFDIKIYGNDNHFNIETGENRLIDELKPLNPIHLSLTIHMSQYYPLIFKNCRFDVDKLFKSVDSTLLKVGLRPISTPYFNNFFRKQPWCSTYNVKRCDLYTDIELTDVQPHMTWLRTLNYPNKLKLIIEGTLYFQNRDSKNRWELCFYDKTCELKDKNKNTNHIKPNSLRMEERLNNNFVKNLTNLSNPNLEDIYDWVSKENLTERFQDHMEKLKIIKKETSND